MTLAPTQTGTQGPVVIITGGSSGIGRDLAEALLRTGASVGIIGHEEALVAQAREALDALPGRCLAVTCDISDGGAVQAAAAAFLEAFGHVDVLVNNAGWATYRTFEETDLEELLRIADVNLLGAVRVTKAFLPGMISRGHGHIINIASIAGMMLITPNAMYGAAKHGLVGLSEALRQELHRFGIAVSVVCPGRVRTRFFDHETFRTRSHRKETNLTVPVGRVTEAILRLMARPRFMTFVPWYWGPASWLYRACPWLVAVPYGMLIRSRVESLYRDRAAGGDR